MMGFAEMRSDVLRPIARLFVADHLLEKSIHGLHAATTSAVPFSRFPRTLASPTPSHAARPSASLYLLSLSPPWIPTSRHYYFWTIAALATRQHPASRSPHAQSL